MGGAPLAADPLNGQVIWRPASPGFYEIRVVDQSGRAAQAKVRLR
ncbi:MAG TPA: hypothetical protein PKB04_05720 [Phenylobacterium sp.]|nr:hypothetical protein [Phenylobacterium sp.]